ncbi:MAG: hydantoinase/oxoprolinase family protein, partial [Bauldia sp.]|nr:hydantoinase/oxoprolinase family protein [Bauldia sp.]
SVVLGIDTGGTFTDFVLVDYARGTISTAKVSSNPKNPAAALMAGLEQLDGVDRIDRIIVGTTVATNAVIERQGPRVLYITNGGFEDVPFIGRLDKERIYDLNWRKPKPLMRRRDTLGVAGRFDCHGNEMAPLTEEDLDALRQRLAAYAGQDVAVAICCLFSYLNGTHEQRVAEAVRAALPDADVSVSHEVSSVWREYERASTTIADAFVKPVVSGYVESVGRALAESGAARHWNLLASNGGYLSAARATRSPAQLLISGLAGGVIGGRHFTELAGHEGAFILDMGGTSADIGLVIAGKHQYDSEFTIDFGIPVTIPCVAVQTIGAGGGSIGWIDKGGLLHVGPRSAGADPGPVAYGRGGTEPTITDANLVLGRLDPEYFLGGGMTLDLAAAHAALEALGTRLGLTAERAALAMLQIADENMANAIRLIAVARGLDTRDFALIAFGGAGPVHGRAVAERLGMSTVIVPPHPGLCSAFGAAIAEARVDRLQTYFMHSGEANLKALDETLQALIASAVDDLRSSVDVAEPEIRCSADMRYAGQNYEIEVPLLEKGVTDVGWAETMDRFAEAHAKLYGFSLPGEPVELINVKVAATKPEPRPSVSFAAKPDRSGVRTRKVWFDDRQPIDTSIVPRSELIADNRLPGPAIIEEMDSTTVVFPGDEIRSDAAGIMIMTLGG